MALVRCSICYSRVDMTLKDMRQLDKSGGVFVCSSSCSYKWAEQNKCQYKGGITHNPGVFESSMDVACDAYSSLVGLGFRSLYEKAVAEWMYEQDIAFMYEPYTFLLKNDTASYTPDFYLPDFGCFLEVKGIWRNRNKLKFFRELYPKVPLLVLPWAIRKTFSP